MSAFKEVEEFQREMMRLVERAHSQGVVVDVMIMAAARVVRELLERMPPETGPILRTDVIHFIAKSEYPGQHAPITVN